MTPIEGVPAAAGQPGQKNLQTIYYYYFLSWPEGNCIYRPVVCCGYLKLKF